MMKRIRLNSTPKAISAQRKLAKHIHRCNFCNREFFSNCSNRGRALGPHILACKERPQDVVCEEEIEGVAVVDGEAYGDCGEEDFDGRVEIDGQIFSDCDDGDVTDDDVDDVDVGIESDVTESEEEEEIVQLPFIFREPDQVQSFAEVFALIQASNSESAGGGRVGAAADVSKSPREMFNCRDFEMKTSSVEPVSRQESNRPNYWFTEGMYVNRNILASDYFCKDVFAAAQLSRKAPKNLPDPDTSIFDYQMEMVDAYFTPSEAGHCRGEQPIKTNKKNGVDKDWRDCSALYNFACTHRLMSRAAGCDLLGLVKTLTGNHGVSLPLHDNWVNLVDAVEKHLSAFHPLHRLSWLMPKWLFGEKDSRDRPMKPVMSVTFDLMKTIGLKLLLVNPKEFAFSPPAPSTPRVISGFHTSDVFINLCQALRNSKGDGAVPLCVMGSWDASTNRSRQVEMTPLVFGFQQTFGASDVIHHAGYFPGKLSYSDNELFKLLRKTWKCTAVGLREQAIKDVKRKYILDFPHSVLGVFLSYEEKGLILQVGTGVDAVRGHFFPFLTTCMGDSAEMDFYCGTNLARLNMNSRFDVNEKIWSHPETEMGEWIVRDSVLMADLSRTAERITIQKMSYCPAISRVDQMMLSKTAMAAAMKSVKASRNEAKQWKKILANVDFFGVTPGTNLNYLLTLWLERHGVASFHLLCPPDKLHTFFLGLIECVLSWTILIIISFDYVLDKAGMQLVDERVRTFPLHQSFNPTKPVKFPDGISCFLKVESTKGTSKGQNSGHVSCEWSIKLNPIQYYRTDECTLHVYVFCAAHLHTWKEAQLMLSLLFSIGTDDAVLPDHNRWRGDSHEIPDCDTPKKIVLRSLVSALESLWFLEKREATIEELDVCHIVLRNTVLHSNSLYRLKQFMVNRGKKPDRHSGMYPALKRNEVTLRHFFYHGVKFHYLTLLPCFQRLYGLTGSGKDTEMTEGKHKSVVKEPLEAISNNTASRQLECARYLQKQAHGECMEYKSSMTGGKGDKKPELTVCNEELECLFLKQFDAKSFKKVMLTCRDGAFVNDRDVSFNGYPFLHPSISLDGLHLALCIYLRGLPPASTKTEREEYSTLQQALDSTRESCRRKSQVDYPHLFLTEGVKMQSYLRCGDLKGTRGSYFLRSTQTYLDERRGPISQRTTHALNSFCFVVNGCGFEVRLARILGILSLQGTGVVGTSVSVPTGEDYFLVVLMTKTTKGYLPYDRYKYSFVDTESHSHADVKIVKSCNVTSPAFVVPTNPVHFRRVDDFTRTTPSFYCISPGRVQCNVSQYSELMSRNTDRCEAFRSVAKMNQMNDSLEASVEEFKSQFRRGKESTQDGVHTDLEPTQAGGGMVERKQTKCPGKKTCDEEDEQDEERGKMKKKKRKSKKRNSDEESEHSEGHHSDHHDDNVF